jgi:hypothetical protein
MLFRKKNSPNKSWQQKVVDLALQNNIKVYEIEEYDNWRIKLVLPNGTSPDFLARNRQWAYEQAYHYIERWSWKDKEERIV